jgi:hypothetical protein
VAETNLNVQLWLKEKERDFSWLRIDKITHRALALLLDETIQSLPQPGELWSQSYSHTFTLTDNILSVHPDSAAFLLVVTDTDNQRLVYVDEINATDTVTGLDDDVASIASTFSLHRRIPTLLTQRPPFRCNCRRQAKWILPFTMRLDSASPLLQNNCRPAPTDGRSISTTAPAASILPCFSTGANGKPPN